MIRMLSESVVNDRTGLSRSTRYRLEKEGLFPRRRQISPGRIGWIESEITEFLESRPVSVVSSGVAE